MPTPTLQEQLDQALTARSRILTTGQDVGWGERRLRLAELAELNKMIKGLEQRIARAKAGSSSLSHATLRPAS